MNVIPRSRLAEKCFVTIPSVPKSKPTGNFESVTPPPSMASPPPKKKRLKVRLPRPEATHVRHVCRLLASCSTSGSFTDALEFAAANEAEGVVLDLRNNTGGSLQAAYNICKCVLPDGDLVQIQGRGESVDWVRAEGVLHRHRLLPVIVFACGIRERAWVPEAPAAPPPPPQTPPPLTFGVTVSATNRLYPPPAALQRVLCPPGTAPHPMRTGSMHVA